MKFNDLSKQDQVVVKKVERSFTSSIKYTDVIALNKGIYNDHTMTMLRHTHTTYNTVLEKIDNAKYSKDVKQYLVHKCQNKANNIIDSRRRELIQILIANQTDFEQRLIKAEARIKSLQEALVNTLSNNKKITNELRRELAQQIQSKEQYIQFIADMFDATYQEAVEAI